MSEVSSDVSKPINENKIDRLMTENAELTRRTDGAESNILAAGKERLAAVSAGLDKLRPTVDLDEEAARKYQDLILERGHLERVIATANKRMTELS